MIDASSSISCPFRSVTPDVYLELILQVALRSINVFYFLLSPCFQRTLRTPTTKHNGKVFGADVSVDHPSRGNARPEEWTLKAFFSVPPPTVRAMNQVERCHVDSLGAPLTAGKTSPQRDRKHGAPVRRTFRRRCSPDRNC